jgi:hypothetical protein
MKAKPSEIQIKPFESFFFKRVFFVFIIIITHAGSSSNEAIIELLSISFHGSHLLKGLFTIMREIPWCS